jgi:hypothetical protein
MSFAFWTNGTYILLAICGLLHSIGGEVWLLRPLFNLRGNRVLDSFLARQVPRFAWHLTSLCWLLIAGLLAVLHQSGTAAADLGFLLTGGLFLAVGLFDLALTRGLHIGWHVLSPIGIFALAAANAL